MPQWVRKAVLRHTWLDACTCVRFPSRPMLTLLVRVADLRLAFPADAVQAIHRAVLIAPLPGAPAVIEGVVHVHGEPIAVVDLCERLALPPRPVLSPDEHLLVLSAGGRRVAVRVDEAIELRDVDDRALARGEGIIAAARTIAGVARLEDGTVTMHDPAAFLTQAEEDALAHAMTENAGMAGLQAAGGAA